MRKPHHKISVDMRIFFTVWWCGGWRVMGDEAPVNALQWSCVCVCTARQHGLTPPWCRNENERHWYWASCCTARCHVIAYIMSLKHCTPLLQAYTCTGCANKKQSIRKNALSQLPWPIFLPNLQLSRRRIRATCTANFVTIFAVV